jgi:hypothetical protein
LGGSRLEASPGKKVLETPILINGWVLWYVPVITAKWGSTNRRIAVRASLGLK